MDPYGSAGLTTGLGQIVYTVARVNASERLTQEEREQVITRLAEELQAEGDKLKYDTAGDMGYVNAIRQRVGRQLVWLDVHKDPDVFSRGTVLSPSHDPVSRLWNHVTKQFRAWERAAQPPRRTGKYLATLHRPEGKRRIEGRLSPLKE